jgi:vitamin B12 transporter
MRRKLLLTLPPLLIFVGAAAQDSSRVTTLREVVISASRSEEPVNEVPRSVSVIPEGIIQASVYQSLGDLLNAQSGVYVVGANQTPGTNQNVFMRGANSNQVAVLIDGVRITDPSSPNAAVDLSEISLANVERIEVIRGSHSTMYGGAAIGGVINLITKKKTTAGFHGVAGWQGGLLGEKAWSSTENVSLDYAAKNGFYLQGTFYQQDAKGLDATEKDGTLTSFTADRDDFQKTDASVKAGFRNDQWGGSVAFKNAHQYAEIDSRAYFDDDNNHLIFDRMLLQYQLEYKVNTLFSLSALGSLSNSERFYENDSSRINSTTFDKAYSTGTYYGKLQTHEAQLNYQQGNRKALLGAGVYTEKMFFDSYFFFNDPDFPFESTANYDTINARTTTGYVFAQMGLDFGNFHLSVGSRFSHHTMSGNVATYEINPSFTFDDLLLYGSLSTGFNAPSLYQLYDPSKGYSAYTTRGNPDLEAERSTSVELGIKKEFSSGSYLTFSVYKTKVTNSIEYVYLWDGATALDQISYLDDRGDTYMNVGDQEVDGLEVEGYVKLSDKFSIKANVSALHAQISIEPEAIDVQHTGGHHVQLYNLGTFLNGDVKQNDLVRRPNLTAFSQLTYSPVSFVTINAAYRYTGKRFDSGYLVSLGPYGALSRIEVDAYHLVDLGLQWRATETFAVGLKVENIFDEPYREVVGFQTRGRSAFLKLTATID